ncbi:hypothetical protein EYS14_11040 [Alteromonadaceae bacterium M269]|nr:hypothetical protein EYS14_11040 [Alteromonadaceae bacterium M269]
MKRGIIGAFLLLLSTFTLAQQTQTDSYTQYELLAPDSHSFRIYYYVSATNAGATHYFNTLRKGSEHDINKVVDLMTGKELIWTIVEGAEARKNGLTSAALDTEYLQIVLARPVPKNGQARLLIDKTYKDEKSYYNQGDTIVFDRSLGIKRNSVVLPKGYEVIGANYPSQVELTDNTRIKTSFMNNSDQAVTYKVTGRKLKKPITASAQKNNSPWPDYQETPSGRDKSKARLDYQLNERAFQNRDITYYLQQPETNAFRLFHDYTEKREGIDKYVNIVRAGSKATDPEAVILDTGEQLKIDTLNGEQISKKNIDLGFEPTPETEAIVIWFDPVKKGQSKRLRITETYTDPNRYLLHNNELVWDRSLGRNRNTVVLPDGWLLTTNSIPAKISLTAEGKVQMRYINDRPDAIDVLIKGKRRK